MSDGATGDLLILTGRSSDLCADLSHHKRSILECGASWQALGSCQSSWISEEKRRLLYNLMGRNHVSSFGSQE